MQPRHHAILITLLFSGCGIPTIPTGIPIPGTHINVPSVGELTTLVPPNDGSIGLDDIDPDDLEDAVFLSPGDRGACYYMSDSDYASSIAHSREIAVFWPRDMWIDLNGYPCDAFPDIERQIPRSDCVRCAEAIFDAAGWN